MAECYPARQFITQKHHAICELHFKNEEVIKEFVHVMPDGSTFKLARDKPSLAKDSIPSIFPTVNVENNKN